MDGKLDSVLDEVSAESQDELHATLDEKERHGLFRAAIDRGESGNRCRLVQGIGVHSIWLLGKVWMF